jgi:hypothetical protein
MVVEEGVTVYGFALVVPEGEIQVYELAPVANNVSVVPEQIVLELGDMVIDGAVLMRLSVLL